MKARKRKLLIVEDNELNRDILAAMLEDDYELLLAENGQEGLEILRQHINEISLVLLDIEMPVMDGYEVLDVVTHDECLREIPVVVTTSNDRLEGEERSLQLGATDFIQKPYNPNVVRCRIGNIIRLKEKTATLTEVETDPVTGIYSRAAFMHYATALLQEQADRDYTLILTDIVGYQRLVELRGDKALELIRKEAEAIERRMTQYSIAGRYSEDQIVCLIPTPKADMNEYDKIHQYEYACSKLSDICNTTIKMGVCEHIDHSLPLDVIIGRAEQALKTVVHQYHRNTAFVNQALMAQLKRNEMLEEAMESALKDHQLEIFFQPKHHATSGKLLGAEVLLRWHHPTLGYIPPSEFIPIFEQTGFIVEADVFAWEQACQYLASLRSRGLPCVPISVNTTRQDYLSHDFGDRLIRAIHSSNIHPEMLHVELTERLFAELDEDTISLLHHLRSLGVKVELDDFGTGYSSLHSLAELPIDIVKFDLNFVRKLEESKRQMDVMIGCVNLVKRLKLGSVAEGVESEKSRQQITNLGIDIIQGYYFSKPLSALEFTDYIRKADVMTRQEYIDMVHDPHQTELDRLRRLAEEDPLTGLNNRYRLFDNVKLRLVEHEPFTLVIFDVDHFKSINDTYGHPVGDMVLVSVADTMRSDFPQSELIRLGGDEFAIIFDGIVGHAQMLSIMQSFFCHVQSLKIEGMSPNQPLSLSAGCVCYRGEEDTTFEHLYTQADQLLYVSKRTLGCCLNFQSR